MPILSMEVMPTLSIETVDIQSREGNTITLSLLAVPFQILQTIGENRKMLDKCFSQAVWEVLQKLFLVIKYVPQEELSSELESIDPFNTRTPLEAEQVLEALSLSAVEPDICDKYFHDYAVLVNGNINLILISKLSNPLKTALDKYYFLFHGKHLQLSSDLYAYVSLKQLIEHPIVTKGTLIPASLTEKDLLEDSTQNPSTPLHKIALNLHNTYLKSLEGWNLLFTSFPLKPAHIELINLSHNKLTEIPPTLLKGFVNLVAISFAYNDLQTVPDELFNECPNITEINLSHNRLKGVNPALIAHSKQLKFLALNHNNIHIFDKKALSKDNPQLVIEFLPSTQEPLTEKRKHAHTNSLSSTTPLALGMLLFGSVVLLKVFVFTLRTA